MADPAAEGGTDDETYPAFIRTADELEARIDLLVAELAELADLADAKRAGAARERRARAH
jgi:hypothetical protein